MGRVLRFTMLVGILVALLPSIPAAAIDDACKGGFSAALECWTKRLGDRPVTLVLDRALRLDGTHDTHAKIIAEITEHRDRLAVQVPAGVSTGEGGTVLLVLADPERRLVDPDARIDRLSASTRKELNDVDVCTAARRKLCDDLAASGKATDPVAGEELIFNNQVTEHRANVAGSSENGRDGLDRWLLPGTATVLALLLAAFVLLVRRTRAPVAVSAVGVSAPAARMPDEPTRALRPTRHRSVTPRARTRPAVVRTDLHPQGYVELDRVLYRAVWADPGQAPPPPGSRVDVTDAPEPDSDVLHAFPPAAGRHAHAR
ncbi:hypothetical protein ACWD3I_11745 [Streptomyces sp. NPDC002817]|uniref:hypothetical protein n=1 Tax=Streptomyces sp. NPDC088357 TaxID=3154655 RepID=UPI0034337974